MVKAQVQIGGRYIKRVSGREVVVKLLNEAVTGRGWIALNEETGRHVRVKSAGSLRRPA